MPKEDLTQVDVASVMPALTKTHGREVDRARRVIVAQKKAAVPLLTTALQDPSPLVRAHALSLLIQTMPHSTSAIPTLLKRLKEEKNSKTYSMVLEAVSKIAPYSMQIEHDLLKALNHNSKLVRWQAVRALGTYGSKAKKTLPALQKKLTSKEGWIRLATALSIYKITGEVKALLSIKGDLRNPDPAIREKFLMALKTITSHPKETVPLLAEGLKDSSTRIRRLTALALKEMGPLAKPATTALKAALKHDDYSIRKYAGETLKVLAAPSTAHPQ